MKKLFLIAFMLSSATAAFSQPGLRDAELGFTVSPNIGWFAADDNYAISNQGLKPGYSYGVLADFALAPNYYIGSALTLTSIHGKTQGSAADAQGYYYSSVYRINYIEIPLTLKLKSRPSELGRYYGQFGLGTGFRIGKKGDMTRKKLGEAPETIFPEHLQDINRIRLSLVMGAGAEWNMGNGMSFLTGISFNNGFTKTNGNNPQLSSKYVALNFGIFF